MNNAVCCCGVTVEVRHIKVTTESNTMTRLTLHVLQGAEVCR
jgi:hypothetical protein